MQRARRKRVAMRPGEGLSSLSSDATLAKRVSKAELPGARVCSLLRMAGQIQLTVTTDTDDVHAVAVEAGATVGELCELLTIYTGIAAEQQVLLFNGKPLSNRMERLDAAGVRNDDLLVLTRRAAAAAPRGAAPGQQNAMGLRPDGSAADPAAFQARV